MSERNLRPLVAALAFAILAIAPAHAAAQECDVRVADTARVFGPGLARVEAAALELENAGADVRVRTVPSFGGFATLDAYEADMMSRCASWRAVDGGRKNNLIVLMMSVSERKVGLYYGSLWKRTLDAQWNSILVDEMVPRFRDGDFAGGFAAGLAEVGGVIRTPRTTGAPGGTTVIREKPTDLTGLWWVLGIALGIAALVLLVLLALRLQRARAARKAAQQKARISRTACASGINELEEPLTMLGIKVGDLEAKASAKDIEPLVATLVRVRKAMADATARYGELDSSASDPDRDGLSEDEYLQIAAAYDGILAMIREVRAGIAELETLADRLRKRMADAPKAIDGAGTALADARKAVDAAAAAGYLVDDQEGDLHDAGVFLDGAKTALAEHRYGEVFDACREAQALAHKAAGEAEGLPARKAAIDRAVADFPERFAEASRAIEEGREAFLYVSATYAERSWSVIRGNGTEAERRLAGAKESVEAATRAASMEAQRWEEAERLVGQASGLLKEASSLMRSILERRKNLDRAKAEIGDEIAAAAADIEAARAFEAAHDDDVADSLKGDIAAAERRLQDARDELAGSAKPDYIAAIKAAMEANEAADRALATARGQHQEAVRKRKLFASTMREAERSISAAKEYIEDHSSDVDSDAERMLDKARTHLRAVERAVDIDSRILRAQEADRSADKALDMAESDVREAEAARRRARERARREAEAAAAALRRSSSSSSGSFSGFGGGGSIGWGGSGGGGGGSIGFGGSGGGGGGSVGW